MQFPIVRTFKEDLDMSNTDNLILGETRDLPIREHTFVFIPKYAPFYIKSLKLYFTNGEPMTRDTHYKVYTIMGSLTKLTNSPVACMIEILDNGIDKVVYDYHTLGHVSILDKTMVSLIEQAMNDDRPIDWDNMRDKPVVFPKELHSHSLLYELHTMEDLAEVVELAITTIENKAPDPVLMKAQNILPTIVGLLNVHVKAFREHMQRHVDSINAHIITKKQVGLEKVDNVRTAEFNDILTLRDGVRLLTNQVKTIIDNHNLGKEKFLPELSLPVSQYAPSNLITTSNSFNLVFNGGSRATFRGKTYLLPQQTINLHDIKANPANSKFYVYLQLYKLPNEDFDVRYIIENALTYESMDTYHVAEVTTNTTGVTNVGVLELLSVSGYAFSSVRRGGVIPVVTGSINSEGVFNFLLYPDDLR